MRRLLTSGSSRWQKAAQVAKGCTHCTPGHWKPWPWTCPGHLSASALCVYCPLLYNYPALWPLRLSVLPLRETVRPQAPVTFGLLLAVLFQISPNPLLSPFCSHSSSSYHKVSTSSFCGGFFWKTLYSLNLPDSSSSSVPTSQLSHYLYAKLRLSCLRIHLALSRLFHVFPHFSHQLHSNDVQN